MNILCHILENFGSPEHLFFLKEVPSDAEDTNKSKAFALTWSDIDFENNKNVGLSFPFVHH